LQKAVQECDLPEGVFSLLFDRGTEVGTELVKHTLVKAVGFTGSRVAGRALMNLAAARPEPIPVFAEMSSTNPVFILPGALRERRDAIATGLHASFTMGAGQFCTKPGLVFLPDGTESADFIDKLRQISSAPTRFHLLTAGIKSSYHSGISGRKSNAKLKVLAEVPQSADESAFCAGATLFATDVRTFLDDSNLADEIFGPATLLIEGTNRQAALQVARNLEGHLTATIYGTDEDLRQYSDLVALLETKVGRLIFNAFPTGVEVCHAMVHGGPYPATSDGRSTSVGSQAIFRFARPVCYQGFPDYALPQELQDGNPLGIWRMVDGKMTREPVSRSIAA
jgi:2,5-dioxopentanoate dehydrogenase